jgi:hypothetical protein
MDTDRYLKLRKELDDIKGMIENVNYQMQELRETIRGAPFPAPMLPMPQPYEHPWWEYQRGGPIPSRNYYGNQIKASPDSSNQTGFGISGTTQTAQSS